MEIVSDFRKALVITLIREGVSFDELGNPIPEHTGYVFDPDDPGGETNYGITKRTARRYGYFGSMKEIPYEIVESIYRQEYWNKVCGNYIADQDISNEMFDTSVLCGPEVVIEFMQRSLNVMNRNGALYPDVLVDGFMDEGGETIKALNLSLTIAPYYKANILKALNCLQGWYLITRAENNPRLEKFVPGWFRIRIN